MGRARRHAKKKISAKHRKSWTKIKRFARKRSNCRYSSESCKKGPVKKGKKGKDREKEPNASLTNRGGELQLTDLTNHKRLAAGALAVSCFLLSSLASSISKFTHKENLYFANFTLLRLCPLLNGTMKADNGASEHGGFGNYNAPTGGAGSPI